MKTHCAFEIPRKIEITPNHLSQGRRHRGGKGGRPPPLKVSKKEKIKIWGIFHALKLAFLSSLIRKYMLWEGFYHDFSTKKVSASGGFAPWPPPRGSAPWTPARGRCPLDPRGNFAPSNDLPWRRPWPQYVKRQDVKVPGSFPVRTESNEMKKE